MPALKKARHESEAIRTMNNLHQIAVMINCFAGDNDGRYPEATATIGTGQRWNWQEPTMMTSCRGRDDSLKRSMGGYLRDYIDDPTILFCPNAPKKYKYMREMWVKGEEWDNPDTAAGQDPVIGTYCFYWGYRGFIEGSENIFKGPKGTAWETGRSELLVSDYFGYGHWRSPGAFGSCERFTGASIREGTAVSSAYWARGTTEVDGLDMIDVDLHAGYTDGHVERYSAKNTIKMRVSMSADGKTPYPDALGPGIFYLPKNAIP